MDALDLFESGFVGRSATDSRAVRVFHYSTKLFSMTEFAEDPFDRWFAPSVDRKKLRGLMKRNDVHGLAFFLAWLGLVLR